MTRYQLDDLEIDFARRQVNRGSAIITLPELSLRVLVCLLAHAPHPVSPDQLSRDVWKQDHVTDDTIAQRIALIRKALSDNPRNPRYIRTLRGEGYVIAGDVRTLSREYWKPVRILAWCGFLTGLASAAFLAISLSSPSQPVVPEENAATAAAAAHLDADTLVARAREYQRVPTADSTNQAIAILGRALEYEPEHALARVQMSFALSNRVTKFGGGPEDQQRAEALARAVLDTRPDWFPAWSALAFALDSQGRIEAAIAAYTHAFTLSPEDTPSMSSAAYLLGIQGRFHDALVLEAQARHLDDPTIYSDIQIAGMLDLLGHRAADRWFARADALNPGQVVVVAELALTHLRERDFDRAYAGLTALPAGTRDTPRIQHLLGRASALQGDRERARMHWRNSGYENRIALAADDAGRGETGAARTLLEEIRRDIGAGDTWPGLRVSAAELAAMLGELDNAEDWVARAVSLGWRDAAWLETSPFLDAFRQDGRLDIYSERIRQALADENRLIANDPRLADLLMVE